MKPPCRFVIIPQFTFFHRYKLAFLTAIVRNIIILALLVVYSFSGLASSRDFKPIEPTDSVNLASSIHAMAEDIRRSGRTTENLTEEDLANLPIGIVKEIAGVQYMIMVDSVRFTPQAAYMNVYASLFMEKTGKQIAFAAEDIIFQPGGLSASTSTRLQLVSPVTIPFGQKIDLILSPEGENYVEFDCNGFKAVNVHGVFEFSRELLLPKDENKEKVQAHVRGNFTDLNNIYASISIDPFSPKKFPDMTVDVNEAFIDLSDLVNPTSMVFPNGYTAPDQNPVFWQGFFIKAAHVALPRKLNGDKGDIRIDAQNLIIDKHGFSGMVGVANLFGTDDGNLNGWPFSIDSLGIHMVRNQLTGAAFRGEMVVPPFDKETPLKYSALIQTDAVGELSYLFRLEITEELKASALVANIELLEGSTIVVKEINGKLQPEALLNGYLSVDAGEKLAVRKLKFESLHLASSKPYIRSGTWSVTSEGGQKMGSFPIAIENVKVTHANDELKLSLDVMLNLMNDESKGFAAETTVSVEGEMEEEAEIVGEETIYARQWVHKRTHISAASIDFSSNAFALKGSVAFYENHSTMGNGFRGELDARFGNSLQVKAVAQFGKVQGFKYWYVDAMATLPVPAGAGFAVYGVGGGLYYRMSIEQASISQYSEFSTITGNNDSDNVGMSRSNTKYIPDINSGLGFKASVIVGLAPEPKPFNGIATFEMSFNNSGGINYIRFLGEGAFMKEITDPLEESQMYATLEVTLDFENDELHGELETYINVANGILRGSHEGGLAGRAVIHVDKTDWYLHVGTPTQNISINLLGAVETGAYFMVGTYIPDFPSVTEVIPEDLVSNIAGDLDNFMRDENALSTGGGIAFGANFRINTGRKEFLIFYGQFDVGAGFDVMLADYGEAYCAGETDLIGINGWYASGQAWVYIQGEIGVFVNLKFIKGEFAIMEVGMAAILQAKLPNPTVINGYITGNYNILGGLVKGDFNFKVSIGEECDIVGVSELGIKVIAEIQPEGSEEVDVFTAPQAAFNVPVDEVFELYDDATNQSKAYKVQLEHFKVLKGTQQISGELEFNQNRKVAIFNSFEILPPNSELTAEVKVSWHERINGIWKPMGGSTPEYEEESITFHTGEAPDYIPESNVEYSYPVTGMYHFYPQEYDEGYLKLKSGQAYLFEDNENFEYQTRIVPVGSLTPKKTTMVYNTSTKTITYDLPDQLEASRSFNIMLVKSPKNQLVVDANVNQIEETIEASADANIVLETQDIEGVVVLEEEELLYESYFATSRYKTFDEKLNSMGSQENVMKILEYWNLKKYGLVFNPLEGFDLIEHAGRGNIEPLVKFEARSSDWFNTYIYPLNYEHYPINNDLTISWREENPLGIPPFKALHIWQRNGYPELSPEDIYTTSRELNNRGNVVLYYNLAYATYRDYVNIRDKINEKYISQINSGNITKLPVGAKYILKNTHIGQTTGSYDFKMYYQLPGRSIRTTERTYTILLK